MCNFHNTFEEIPTDEEKTMRGPEKTGNFAELPNKKQKHPSNQTKNPLDKMDVQ